MRAVAGRQELRRSGLVVAMPGAGILFAGCAFIKEGAMKAGRNDPCPCGSGKKYKKCCLGTDRVASATRALAVSSPRSVTGSAGSDSFDTEPRETIGPSKSARASRAPKPSSPPDPVVERADRFWEDFQSQSAEGRIGVFLEAVEDAEVMDDEIVFEMMSRLRSDAMKCGDRRRFCEVVSSTAPWRHSSIMANCPFLWRPFESPGQA